MTTACPQLQHVVGVLLGNGDGLSSQRRPTERAATSRFGAVEDVNGDGKLDIVGQPVR